MAFEIEFPTRHTDAFAETGFVHAGVLLALTELAYAAFEADCGIRKTPPVYAVQRATEAVYRSPLRWTEGARIAVRTLDADESGFDQEYRVRSATDGREIARFIHHWAWVDTATGKRLPLPEDVQVKLRSG